MKQKMSITIEEDIIIKIDEKVKEGIFRNKSHFLEFASSQLLKENKQND